MKGLFNMGILRKWIVFFLNAVKEQKIYFCLNVFLIISICLLGSFSTIITGNIMNLIQKFSIGDIKYKLIFLLFVLLLIQMIYTICGIVHSNILLKSNYKLKKYTSRLYVDILNKMDYLKMCKSDYKKSLDIISNELINNTCISDSMILFKFFFSSIVSFFIIGNYTLNFSIWLFITLFIIFLLSLLTGVIRSKIYLHKRNNLMGDIREENYLANLFDNLNISREFFFFPVQKIIFNKWKNKFESNNKQLVKEKNKGEIFNIVSICLIVICVFLYLFLIAKDSENYLFGTFFIILLSILNISNNIMHLGMICNRFYISARNLSEIDRLNKNLEDFHYTYKKDSSELIEFKNVSFKYTDLIILKNINVQVKKGEKVGIVGVNGCGKTTLIKLLCGLYSPSKGEINVFGQNCYENLMLKKDIPISIVMQDFSIYHGYTIEENITLGKNEPNYDICKELGSLQNIVEKKDSIVGERFGGTDLSKGQWQLVSILRAINVDKEVIVLDEPTASLDPITEKKIYEEFLRMNSDKTIFVITHRLASVKNVDRILYMENGTIVEDGSHIELMNIENGKYRCLFNEQAKWYKEDK